MRLRRQLLQAQSLLGALPSQCMLQRRAALPKHHQVRCHRQQARRGRQQRRARQVGGHVLGARRAVYEGRRRAARRGARAARAEVAPRAQHTRGGIGAEIAAGAVTPPRLRATAAVIEPSGGRHHRRCVEERLARRRLSHRVALERHIGTGSASGAERARVLVRLRRQHLRGVHRWRHGGVGSHGRRWAPRAPRAGNETRQPGRRKVPRARRKHAVVPPRRARLVHHLAREHGGRVRGLFGARAPRGVRH
mmetsp:Transcript_8216/g.25341  ORF Transcript_8216/g.25341 Transcript_8216/m.25341 type:complete len:250 (-) Transcript_8216:185-934(-)